MFRFTIRDMLWLMVVVAMAAAVFFTRSARESDLRQATHRASAQEIEAANARYEAAKGEFDQHSDWPGYGFSRDATDVCDAIERFAHATEMKNDPDLRIKDLSRALGLAQTLASVTQDRYEQGVEHPTTLYRTQYTRADMEARSRRAEQELAAARPQR